MGGGVKSGKQHKRAIDVPQSARVFPERGAFVGGAGLDALSISGAELGGQFDVGNGVGSELIGAGDIELVSGVVVHVGEVGFPLESAVANAFDVNGRRCDLVFADFFVLVDVALKIAGDCKC